MKPSILLLALLMCGCGRKPLPAIYNANGSLKPFDEICKFEIRTNSAGEYQVAIFALASGTNWALQPERFTNHANAAFIVGMSKATMMMKYEQAKSLLKAFD